MSEAAEVPIDCGPHPKAPVSWCPSCGVSRWPRYGDDDTTKVRRRCPTERCRGHLVSLKLHPMPQPTPVGWRVILEPRGVALAMLVSVAPSVAVWA